MVWFRSIAPPETIYQPLLFTRINLDWKPRGMPDFPYRDSGGTKWHLRVIHTRMSTFCISISAGNNSARHSVLHDQNQCWEVLASGGGYFPQRQWCYGLREALDNGQEVNVICRCSIISSELEGSTKIEKSPKTTQNFTFQNFKMSIFFSKSKFPKFQICLRSHGDLPRRSCIV